MATWVACYNWNKGSALVFGSKLVAVGPTSKWNHSAILYRHVEDLMRAAKEVLEARVVAAAGVGLRFAAGYEWLAARLADPALEQQVLLAQAAVEYRELCNGGPSTVPRPKVLLEGQPILHSYNYTLTINNNYRTDHYCSRFSYYYKNQSSTM